MLLVAVRSASATPSGTGSRRPGSWWIRMRPTTSVVPETTAVRSGLHVRMAKKLPRRIVACLAPQRSMALRLPPYRRSPNLIDGHQTSVRT